MGLEFEGRGEESLGLGFEFFFICSFSRKSLSRR